MFEPVRFCCLCHFELQGQKRKKYFQNFVQIVRSLESNNCNATTNDLKPKKTYWWMLWISMMRNSMVLQKLQCFVMWLAGILTDWNYKELVPSLPFLFSTGTNMWGILANLFSKVDFCTANPIWCKKSFMAIMLYKAC